MGHANHGVHDCNKRARARSLIVTEIFVQLHFGARLFQIAIAAAIAVNEISGVEHSVADILTIYTRTDERSSWEQAHP